ncbi:MAG: hypothetical protein ACYST6_03105 [Planctomycetota bacterium]
MRLKLTRVSCLILCAISIGIVAANDRRTTSGLTQLPPMETLLLEPIELENTSVWVPAAKVGPEINRSCRMRTGYSHSALLPATVDHTKTESCPEEAARLLAEHTAGYQAGRLPLTILAGWRWEYSYSLSQFGSSSFDLHARGGAWENCWEAILNHSTGHIALQWAPISDANNFTSGSDYEMPKSNIEVTTFSSMRTRYGYPKERKLSR